MTATLPPPYAVQEEQAQEESLLRAMVEFRQAIYRRAGQEGQVQEELLLLLDLNVAPETCRTRHHRFWENVSLVFHIPLK